MAYCESKDVRAVLTQVDRDTLEEEEIDAFILKANTIIDTILSKKYAVPFASVPNSPPIIKELCADIAAFYSMRKLFTGVQPNSVDYTKTIYSTAMEILNSLATGAGVIKDIDGTTIAQLNQDKKVYSKSKNYSPTFDMDNYLNHEVSPTRLEDIATTRENG